MDHKIAYVLAVTATLHYTSTPYLHGDGPSAPPRAAVVALTSSANSSVTVVTHAVTGIQYSTAPDLRPIVTFKSSAGGLDSRLNRQVPTQTRT